MIRCVFLFVLGACFDELYGALDCDVIPTWRGIVYTTVTPPNATFGITYRCAEGYKRGGRNKWTNSTCDNATGIWIPDVITCTPAVLEGVGTRYYTREDAPYSYAIGAVLIFLVLVEILFILLMDIGPKLRCFYFKKRNRSSFSNKRTKKRKTVSFGTIKSIYIISGQTPNAECETKNDITHYSNLHGSEDDKPKQTVVMDTYRMIELNASCDVTEDNKYVTLETKLNLLSDKVSILQEHSTKIMNENEMLKTQVQELQSKQERIEGELSTTFSLSLNDEIVGFTASKDSSQSHELNEVILFENSVSNYGNHYKNETGVFTCPVDGVYYISVSLQRNSNDILHSDVMLNDMIILTLYDVRTENPLNTITNSGFFTCYAYNIIRVVGAATGGAVFGGAYPVSTFSVYLVSSL